MNKSIELKADNPKNARYYSGEISILKQNSSRKLEVDNGKTFMEKAKLILSQLNQKDGRKGELTMLLSELNIEYASEDIFDFSKYFKDTNYARVSLYKGGCYLVLTNFGRDFLKSEEGSKTETNSTLSLNVRIQVPLELELDEKDKISNLIREDNLIELIELLEKNRTEPEFISQLNLIGGRLAELEKSKENGTVSRDQFISEKNRIRESLLRLCNTNV